MISKKKNTRWAKSFVTGAMTRDFHSKILHKNILFLFFLLSQCRFAWGAITYSYVYSELCGSVSGRHELGTKAACEAAAVSLDNSDTSAGVFSNSGNPPGCWKNGNTLYFNTLTTSTTKCGSSGYTCLCATGPLCSETDGTTANSAGCICGAAVCTPTTGLFCISSLNICHKTCSLGEYRSAGTSGVCT